jgi:hypothetical protein
MTIARITENPSDVILRCQKRLTENERAYRPDNPWVLQAREDLADAYVSAARFSEAIPVYEQVLTDLPPGEPLNVRMRIGDKLGYARVNPLGL